MAEPVLNLFQADAVCEKQAGAGVAKIVKADMLHSVLFQEIVEMVRDEIGRQQIAKRIDADIIEIILAVGTAAELLPFGLRLFRLDEQRLPPIPIIQTV